MSTIEKAMAKLKGLSTETGPADSKSELNQDAEARPSHTRSPLLQEEIPEPQVAEAAPATPASVQQHTKTAEARPRDNDAGNEVKKAVKAKPQASKAPAPMPTKATETDDQSTEDNRSSQYSQIDTESLTSRGFITAQSNNRILKEQFRAVKRKLLSNAFGPIAKTLHHPNLIIVSSCNPHEGKTFTAINLALSIALEQDKKVLLVDADVVRPSLVRELGLEPQDGLTEYLLGNSELDVSDIIHSTNIDNFRFIAAGQPHELSTELLASERMATLTEELASRYHDRVVIFDAPPLLGVNETHVMANLVGQAVVVVEENRTKLSDIQTAVEQLEKKLAIGFLINKSLSGAKDQYGYGYGYYKKD